VRSLYLLSCSVISSRTGGILRSLCSVRFDIAFIHSSHILFMFRNNIISWTWCFRPFAFHAEILDVTVLIYDCG
jgi:hypothetical protein